MKRVTLKTRLEYENELDDNKQGQVMKARPIALKQNQAWKEARE